MKLTHKQKITGVTILSITLLILVCSLLWTQAQRKVISTTGIDVLSALDKAGYKIEYVEPTTAHDYCPRFNEIDARLFRFTFLGDQYEACVRVFDDWSYTKELNNGLNQSNLKVGYNLTYSMRYGTVLIDYLSYDRPPRFIPQYLVKINLMLTLMFSDL